MAILFYNYPPGKAGVGASYLNVADSLANVLQRLRADGYDLGDPEADLSSEALLDRILARARNVGSYAPGELAAMIDEGGAARAWLGDYLRWLNQGYVPELRDKVIADWGDPADATLMAADGSLIIPALRFGNVAVLPQPARGWGEDAEQLYHADDLAPHHQYVAAYSWLRAERPVGFDADAVIHLGTHGTLEWLDGKDLGLSAADAPDALIADLPNLYVYNVDVVGEGLVARRRGMATLVDHMVPPFVESELLPDLAALSESVDDYHEAVHKNEQLAEAYADQLRQQATDLGMVKDLDLDLGTGAEIDHDALHAVEDYLRELQGQSIPYGLHAFGRTPEPEMRASTVDAIVSVDRSLLPEGVAVMAADMERRIVESGPRELEHLLRALDGGYVSAGGGGEPIRNPDAYPTGKNFYGIDPDKVPKPAAWRLGVVLADRMLADHVAEHGRYPEKVSFVIWGTETLRHEGVLESQIFHLLGTRPVWDARGKVVDVEVIPARELGRPRVDIVIASAAEGMFNNVTRLMDERGAAGEGAGGSRELRPPALPGDEGRAGRARLLGGGRGPSRRRPDLRRAAGEVQPEHVANRGRERDVGQRPADGRRVPLEAGARLRQRVLGRADGGRLPPRPLRHREGGAQQLHHALRRPRQRRLLHVRGRAGRGGPEHRRREPRAGGDQHARSGPARDDVDRQVPGGGVPDALRQPDLDRGDAAARATPGPGRCAPSSSTSGAGTPRCPRRSTTGCGRSRSRCTWRTSTTSS